MSKTRTNGAEKSAADESREPRPDAPARVIALACAVKDAGGRALLVGGCVRDHLLGRESKDWDVEVYGIEPLALRELLKRFGKVNTVGEAFTVYKLGGDTDVSLPRRERKQGRGHRGFVIEGDPYMSIEEAARRRDFTINAMLQDPLTGELLDPFGGREDLRAGVLRHIAADTFVEDSLRVLRAAQFAARFSLTIAPETIALCRSIRLDDLPPERVWGEMEKLLRAARPSEGLRWFAATNATAQLFPELAALNDETTSRTARALDHARTLTEDLPYPKRTAIMLAALCHRFTAPRAAHVEQFLDNLKIYTLGGYDVRAQTLALISEQSRPAEIFSQRGDAETSDAALRRLALRCELELLHRFAFACALACEDAEGHQAAEWFIARARFLSVNERPLPALIGGKDLIDFGLAPSPRFGEIIARVYEMQLDGIITNADEARVAAQDIIATGVYG